MYWKIYIYIYICININYNYSNSRQRWSDCVHIILYIYAFFTNICEITYRSIIIKARVFVYYNLIDKKCKEDLSIDMSANALLYNLYLSCSHKHFKDFKIFILKLNMLYKKKDNFIYIILLNVSVNLRATFQNSKSFCKR